MHSVPLLPLRHALLAVAALVASLGPVANRGLSAGDPSPPAPARFTLSSDDLTPGRLLPARHVFKGFGRDGGNRSPHLRWQNAPAGTRSFVVTLFDPDAPTGSGWWHWVVVDIPARTHELASEASRSDQLPPGARETRTDFGAPGYGGAAPPPGEIHRYVFTVHALDVERLDVPVDASPAMVGFLVHAHSLGKASLSVLFGP